MNFKTQDSCTSSWDTPTLSQYLYGFLFYNLQYMCISKQTLRINYTIISAEYETEQPVCEAQTNHSARHLALFMAHCITAQDCPQQPHLCACSVAVLQSGITAILWGWEELIMIATQNHITAWTLSTQFTIR